MFSIFACCTIRAAAPQPTASTARGGLLPFATRDGNHGGLSASSLFDALSVAVDGAGGLYIGDHGNCRVLHFPSGSTTADRVYGQGGSFITADCNHGSISATILQGAFGVAVDAAGGLYVADVGDNSVLHYPPSSTTADAVYGQGGSFTTNDANHGGLTANSIYQPYGVAIDAAGGLYIAGGGNNRVLYFSITSDVTPPAASPTQMPPANAA